MAFSSLDLIWGERVLVFAWSSVSVCLVYLGFSAFCAAWVCSSRILICSCCVSILACWILVFSDSSLSSFMVDWVSWVVDWVSWVVDWVSCEIFKKAEMFGCFEISFLSSVSLISFLVFWTSCSTNFSINTKTSSSVLFWSVVAKFLIKSFSFFIAFWCWEINCIALFLSSGENLASWLEILFLKLGLFFWIPSIISVLEGLMKSFSPSQVIFFCG